MDVLGSGTPVNQVERDYVRDQIIAGVNRKRIAAALKRSDTTVHRIAAKLVRTGKIPPKGQGESLRQQARRRARARREAGLQPVAHPSLRPERPSEALAVRELIKRDGVTYRRAADTLGMSPGKIAGLIRDAAKLEERHARQAE